MVTWPSALVLLIVCTCAWAKPFPKIVPMVKSDSQCWSLKGDIFPKTTITLVQTNPQSIFKCRFKINLLNQNYLSIFLGIICLYQKCRHLFSIASYGPSRLQKPTGNMLYAVSWRWINQKIVQVKKYNVVISVWDSLIMHVFTFVEYSNVFSENKTV